MARLLRSSTANMNTRGLVQGKSIRACARDRLEAHRRRQPLRPLVMVTQGRVAIRLDKKRVDERSIHDVIGQIDPMDMR
jgi:hypothetical protein